MKRLVSLRGYIEALFKDLAPMYTKVSELRRDQSRLVHEVEHHGLQLLTIALPSVSKHFDKCLGQGLYTPSGLHMMQPRKGMKVPRFTEDLHLQVFDNDGVLRSDADVNAVLALRQLYKGLNKVKLPCSAKENVNEAIAFLRNEQDLKSPRLDWGGGLFGPNRSRDLGLCARDIVPSTEFPDLDLLGYGKCTGEYADRRTLRCVAILQQTFDITSNSLGDFFDESLTRLFPKHGPGRVSDQKKTDSKYLFPNWSMRLESCYPYDLFGLINQKDVIRDSERRPSSHEAPSKLIAVPKTMKGPRLIASEPTSNMWIQQLIKNQIEDKVKQNRYFRNCISFEDQSPNQRMALKASKDDSLATVDLSSASDRLSLRTLEVLFRKNLSMLNALRASRTRYVQNVIAPHQWDYILLKKAFTQGNACTFPVQTLAYSMMSIAAVLISEDTDPTPKTIEKASRSIRVFGDDIIVPQTAFAALKEILNCFQLIVNSDKTFPKGRFRESCGLDGFDGYSVTPTYIKGLIERPQHENAISTIQSVNNLMDNGWFHLSKWQEGLLSNEIRNSLKFIEPRGNDTGMVSYSGSSATHLKRRWNEGLQREEVLSVTLKVKSLKRQTGTSSELFQYFIERPAPDLLWESGVQATSACVLRKQWIAQRETQDFRSYNRSKIKGMLLN